MKFWKISILNLSTVLLLSVGLVSGCGDAEEEENAAAPAIVAPIPSEGATYEPMVDESTAAIEEESFSIEGLEEYEPIESISDMLEEAKDTAGEAIDNTVDSMLGMVDSGVDATENLIEDTQETSLEVIETIEEPQAQALDHIDDATDVVPATSDIISSVQQSLTDSGFNPGPADGMSGPRTVAAINDFQNQNNLASGGQLTKETLRALGVGTDAIEDLIEDTQGTALEVIGESSELKLIDDATELADIAKKYKIELLADKLLKIPGSAGQLRVWIGGSDFDPQWDFKENKTKKVRMKTDLPAVSIRKTAKVTVFAPDFKVEPEETKCIEIDITGSEVAFELTPKKPGKFEISARVNLFKSVDCSGALSPKTSRFLNIEVEVNDEEILEGRLDKAGDVFWKTLIDFWKALLALFSGLILYLIRGKIKKLFGYVE